MKINNNIKISKVKIYKKMDLWIIKLLIRKIYNTLKNNHKFYYQIKKIINKKNRHNNHNNN